ncbi:hypothetical protein CH249_01420 [Rhodococcus sp. 05-2255-3B1]|uniref:ScbA/BarX family gamma-butyrolactone biosynthesis protein n=1 Tax=unclassified Rhodococcus (in: high G+C Gram-positive bacteria) TaxID=192944 RepID=UPI000B9A1F02|nr:hypothetical protein CH250_05945 [Rhodococcus sp. 05-2255-3C]OZE15943.1 hypothetical protein CH249_01420 [Rhodococcus sp. 05-2255-3B1]OZE18982.1 hypothetical protein CH255_13445 [Rhodococcus sp. 05-2255-2A2]
MQLSYTTTVPRQLVHKRAVSEVFLTDYRVVQGSADAKIAVQVPASHRGFRPTRERHDPLIAVEAFRQAVILLCHTKFLVPQCFKFLMEQLSFEMLDALRVSPAPTPLVLDVTTAGLDSRDGTVSRVEVAGTLREGTRILARFNAITRCVTPTCYSRMRGGRDSTLADRRTNPPGSVVIPANCVGRAEEQDVVIAANVSADELFCAPDPRNHALFDHPLDHIPGMVMFDAAIQASRYRENNPTLQLTRLAAKFPLFTEWDSPCNLAVVAQSSSPKRGPFFVTFAQSGRTTAQFDISTESVC